MIEKQTNNVLGQQHVAIRINTNMLLNLKRNRILNFFLNKTYIIKSINVALF